MATVHLKITDKPAPEPGTANTEIELDFDDTFDPDNPTRAESAAIAFMKAMTDTAIESTTMHQTADGKMEPLDMDNWTRRQPGDPSDDDTNFTR